MKRIVLLCLLAAAALALPVYANSSWVWVSETRPFDVLPFVAAATVLIEWLAVWRFAGARDPLEAFFVILLANVLSFLMPYATAAFGSPYSIREAVAHLPRFTVGGVFFFMTLAAELPVVYYFLKRAAAQPKRLLRVLLAANAATTALTALAERLLCRGHW
ncbi:MAG: hypothetical protein IIY16_03390 [Oscillospiraceae bacterium]|nr:hypothetical protein [Oscillospiraceae bacterium]